MGRLFRALLDEAPFAAAILDQDGRILQSNRALAEALGSHGAPGRSLLDSVHPDDGPGLRAQIARVRAGEPDAGRSERRFLRADGSSLWVSLALSLATQESGEPLYIVAYLEDVTERLWLEQLVDAVLRAHDELGEAVLIGDARRRIVSANEGATALLGYSPDELRALPSFLDLIVPEERARIEEISTRRIRGEWSPTFYETALLAKGGRRVSVEIAVRAVRASGDFNAIAVIRDVTGRKRAEATLRRQNEELTALYETTLGLVNRRDPTSLLEAIVSRAAALIGTEHGYLYVLDPDGEHLVVRVGTGIFADWIGYRLARGEGVGGRVWQTGRTFAVDDYRAWPERRPEFDFLRATLGIPLRLGSDIVGVIGLARLEDGRPFTRDEIELLRRFAQMASLALENARLFEAERKAAERLRALDETRKGFVSAISHELRTPLAITLGYALTLERGEERFSPEQRSQMLHGIVAGARGIERLFSDFVELDRLVRDEGRAVRKPYDVSQIARRAVAEADLGERTVEVGAEPALAEVDEVMVRRIFEKLLDNVAKHTPRGTHVWVRAETVPEGLLLSVTDDGPGVPAELRRSIFEPFLQGPDTPSYSPGVGVGLGLVARFAELHGGRAWAEDRPGGGAAFRVLIPPPRPDR